MSLQASSTPARLSRSNLPQPLPGTPLPTFLPTRIRILSSAVIVDSNNLTLPAQRPIEDGRIYFRTHIPPMPLPVSASTPDNLLHTQISYENTTHVQPELGGLAWKYLAAPNELLAGERWQAISDLGSGKVLYESREVYSGALAVVLKESPGKDLQASFEAQGAFGLKLLLEGGE